MNYQFIHEITWLCSTQTHRINIKLFVKSFIFANRYLDFYQLFVCYKDGWF